jgi:iron-sulfur cluster repair protein YtfE (RIC family)
MTHACNCEGGPEATERTGGITAGDIVGQVARRHQGALEVMKALEINHCCGAQLTLGEAAAAAGIPVEVLFRALNDKANGRG